MRRGVLVRVVQQQRSHLGEAHLRERGRLGVVAAQIRDCQPHLGVSLGCPDQATQLLVSAMHAPSMLSKCIVLCENPLPGGMQAVIHKPFIAPACQTGSGIMHCALS